MDITQNFHSLIINLFQGLLANWKFTLILLFNFVISVFFSCKSDITVNKRHLIVFAHFFLMLFVITIGLGAIFYQDSEGEVLHPIINLILWLLFVTKIMLDLYFVWKFKRMWWTMLSFVFMSTWVFYLAFIISQMAVNGAWP